MCIVLVFICYIEMIGGEYMVTALSVLVLVSSVAMIACWVVSEPAEDGMGALTGQSNTDSFWDASRGDSKKVLINRVTILSGIVFTISLLLLAKY